MQAQAKELLGQFSIAQKLMIGGVAAGSVVALLLFVMIAGQPTMEPAFKNLSTADAGTISAALRSSKVEFQLTDGGATILVPSKSVADAKVAASEAGYASGSTSTGFELFDKSGFGMSDFDQQVAYQRAINGELEKTITAMSGVESARVSVVQAKTGTYATQDQPATASVVITMKNRQAPSAAMVRGIVSTVSSSVSGLTASNVTVVDEAGKVLSGQDATSGALASQQAIENQAALKVQQLVDQAFGAGKASVAVSATMDLAKVEQEITTYTPVDVNHWTPVSVSTSTELYGPGASPGLGAAGIAGSGSNIPGLITYPGASATPAPSASASPGASASPSASAVASPAASAATTYGKVDQTVNYNLSQTVQKIVQDPGTLLKRMSVAVLVDETAAKNINTEELAKSIQAAVGYDATRGDVVSVTAVPFAAAADATSSSGSPLDAITGIAGGGSGSSSTGLSGIIGTAIGGVMGAALLFLLWKNMKGLRRHAEELEALVAPVPTPQLEPGMAAAYAQMSGMGGAGSMAGVPGMGGMHGMGGMTPAQLSAHDPAASMAGFPDPMQSMHASAQDRIQERLRNVADEKPDALVGLMNGWIREDAHARKGKK